MKGNMKVFLIILFVLLLISLSACGQKKAYFEDISLGMPREEIFELRKEWGKPFEDESSVEYENIEYYDLKVSYMNYRFDQDGKLYQTNIYIDPAVLRDESGYQSILNTMTKKYGSPTESSPYMALWQLKFKDRDAVLFCSYDQDGKIMLSLITKEAYEEIKDFLQEVEEKRK